MKIFLPILSTLLISSTLLMGAAAPLYTPWTAFIGTNGIIITTNRTTQKAIVSLGSGSIGSAGQILTSTGTAVAWSNAPLVLNVNQVEYLIGASNIFSGTSGTNLLLDFDLGSITVFATNGFSMTNFANLETSWGTKEKNLRVHVLGCTNTASVITLPAFSGVSYQGVYTRTNDARPIYTSITNAVLYDYLWTAKGTNIQLAVSVWQ